jgi:hypothetical protein
VTAAIEALAIRRPRRLLRLTADHRAMGRPDQAPEPFLVAPGAIVEVWPARSRGSLVWVRGRRDPTHVVERPSTVARRVAAALAP